MSASLITSVSDKVLAQQRALLAQRKVATASSQAREEALKRRGLELAKLKVIHQQAEGADAAARLALDIARARSSSEQQVLALAQVHGAALDLQRFALLLGSRVGVTMEQYLAPPNGETLADALTGARLSKALREVCSVVEAAIDVIDSSSSIQRGAKESLDTIGALLATTYLEPSEVALIASGDRRDDAVERASVSSEEQAVPSFSPQLGT